MNNQKFSFKHFAVLLKEGSQFGSWKKIGVVVISPVFGLIIAFLLFIIYDYATALNNTSQSLTMEQYLIEMNSKYATIISAMFIALMLIYLSYIMKPMQNKKESIQYLMLPGSTLEKFLSRILPPTIGYTILFWMAIWLMDIIKVAICTPLFPHLDIQFIDYSILYSTNSPDAMFRDFSMFLIFISYLGVFISYLVLGRIFIQKSRLLKTLSIIVVASFILYKYIVTLMSILSDGNNIYENKYLNPEYLFFGINTPTLITASIVLTLFNFILSYFRFKELEITQKK